MLFGSQNPLDHKDETDNKFQAPRGNASLHLDMLRGLAALSVLYSHWWDAFYASYDSLPTHNPLLQIAYFYCGLGHAWVIVFFVLSGYLVGGSVLRSYRNGSWSWRRYLLIRCTRIYVVLIPALLLGGALDWAGMHQSGAQIIYSGHSGMGALYYNAYLSLTPTAFFQSLIFLGLGAPGFGSNGPLWSLALEFWYYMAFPFIVVVCLKQLQITVRVGGILGLLAWAVLVGGYTVSLFPVWLAGAAILLLPAFPKRTPWGTRQGQRFLILLAIALLIGGFVLRSRGLLFPDASVTVGRSHWHPPIADNLLSPIVALFIWVILNCSSGSLSKGYAWIAKRAAESSYTVYLFHVPALVFIKAFLQLPRVIPTWQNLPFHLILLLLVFGYAQLAYWLFERNTDKVRKWLQPFVIGKDIKNAKSPHVESPVG